MSPSFSRRRIVRMLYAVTGAVVALAALSAPGLPSPASAGEVHEEGRATLPLMVEPEGLEVPLHLNGAATLRSYFVRVYSIGIYTPEPTTDAGAIITAGHQPRRVHLFFAYRGIDGQDILNAWEDGLDENLEGARREAMGRAIEEHRDVFRIDVERGDEVVYDYRPGEGTEIRHNGERVAFIEDPVYFEALLSFWIGERPVDRGARDDLLKGGYR